MPAAVHVSATGLEQAGAILGCFVILILLSQGLKGSQPIYCTSKLLVMSLRGTSVWSELLPTDTRYE